MGEGLSDKDAIGGGICLAYIQLRHLNLHEDETYDIFLSVTFVLCDRPFSIRTDYPKSQRSPKANAQAHAWNDRGVMSKSFEPHSLYEWKVVSSRIINTVKI